MKMPRFLLAAGLFAAGAFVAGTAALAGPKAVVELFTSQGCSSCPPADRFAGDLKQRDDIIVLSLPVDYWDYLGWKDTFGRSEHTDRQYAYSRVRGDNRVYTPQIVVNGGEHFVGSQRPAVEKALARESLPVGVSIAMEGDSLNIDVAGTGKPADHTTIRLVTFTSEADVAVGRGENSGRKLTYHNVVRSMRPIGMWEGGPVSISLPRGEIMKADIDGCAVLVQQDTKKGPGRILGAAALTEY